MFDGADKEINSQLAQYRSEDEWGGWGNIPSFLREIKLQFEHSLKDLINVFKISGLIKHLFNHASLK